MTLGFSGFRWQPIAANCSDLKRRAETDKGRCNGRLGHNPGLQRSITCHLWFLIWSWQSPSHLPLISLSSPSPLAETPTSTSTVLIYPRCSIHLANDDVVQAICIIDSAIMGTVRASGSSCEEVNGEGCARRSGTWEPLSM